MSVYFKCIVKCRIKTVLAWDVIRRTSLSSILHSNVYTELRKTSRFVASKVATNRDTGGVKDYILRNLSQPNASTVCSQQYFLSGNLNVIVLC